MRKSAVLTAAVVLALTVAGLASAQPAGLRQTARNLFTTTRPSSSTGLVVKVDYVNPTTPGAKPPAVRRIVTRLHAGTRIDTSVPVRCDEARALAGRCPAASRVGGGVVTIDTGLPQPNRVLVNDTTLFDASDGLLFVTRERRTGATTVDRARVRGNTIDVPVPPLPGTPPDGGALLTIRLTMTAMSRGGRSFITTPARCPRSRRWTNRATFTYTDGVTQTVGASMPCARSARRAPRFTG